MLLIDFKNVAGIYSYFITCTASTQETRFKHFFRAVQPDGYDVKYLLELFNTGIYNGPDTEECSVVEPMATRKQSCGK
jgi:hypothetical protein